MIVASVILVLVGAILVPAGALSVVTAFTDAPDLGILLAISGVIVAMIGLLSLVLGLFYGLAG